MTTQAQIDELYGLVRELRAKVRALPECGAKNMVDHALGVLHRTLGKLDEDLLCEVCKQDIKPDDEVAFYYKQRRHAACHAASLERRAEE